MKKSVLGLCSTIVLSAMDIAPTFATTIIDGGNITACTKSNCNDILFPTVSNTLITPSHCTATTDTCYQGGTRVRTCTSCESGYTLTSAKTYIVTCDKGTWTTSYQDCSSSGSGGGGFTESGFSTVCMVGQYKSTIDSTCVDCPTPGTSKGGATAITDCYIPKNTEFSDATGSGVYTDDCHYFIRKVPLAGGTI